VGKDPATLRNSIFHYNIRGRRGGEKWILPASRAWAVEGGVVLSLMGEEREKRGEKHYSIYKRKGENSGSPRGRKEGSNHLHRGEKKKKKSDLSAVEKGKGAASRGVTHAEGGKEKKPFLRREVQLADAGRERKRDRISGEEERREFIRRGGLVVWKEGRKIGRRGEGENQNRRLRQEEKRSHKKKSLKSQGSREGELLNPCRGKGQASFLLKENSRRREKRRNLIIRRKGRKRNFIPGGGPYRR